MSVTDLELQDGNIQATLLRVMLCQNELFRQTTPVGTTPMLLETSQSLFFTGALGMRATHHEVQWETFKGRIHDENMKKKMVKHTRQEEGWRTAEQDDKKFIPEECFFESPRVHGKPKRGAPLITNESKENQNTEWKGGKKAAEHRL